MLAPLRQFAGFTCTEGQAAANFKQLLFTSLAGLLVALLLVLTRKSPRKRLFWFAIIPLGTILVLATLIVSPFLYSSWGCDNYVQELLFGS